MQTIYLDHAATTPVADEVRAAMRPWLEEEFGNPSSRHPIGLRAADAVDEARRALARTCGVRAQDVVFTSGGTEANNLGVIGLARAAERSGAGADERRVLVGPGEHPSVRASADALRAEGFAVDEAPLGADGALDLERFAALLSPATALVALMLVNNELGTIFPVRAAARLVRAHAPRARLHVDAVQALGKLELALGELGADSLAISAHKVHGPKGAGALVLREGVEPRPLLVGGGQERGLRSGTENVAGIVGLARAAGLADARRADFGASARAARAALVEGLTSVRGAELVEPAGERVDAIASVRVPGPPAEVWMHHLETHGVYVSTGAACQAKKGAISPALLALGLSERDARQILRFSFSRFTTADEVRGACEALRAVERELGAARR